MLNRLIISGILHYINHLLSKTLAVKCRDFRQEYIPQFFSQSVCVCVFRKREEEQRRREQISAEKQRAPLERTEQEVISLVNIVGELTMNDSVVETKKSSKAEHNKSKVERHKGINVAEF